MVKMKAVGWYSSSNNETGAGYGIKIECEDRDAYFSKEWPSVTIELDNGESIDVTLSNSFWRKCTELRHKKIGKWMIEKNIAPWEKGRPPNLGLEPIGNRKFRLVMSQYDEKRKIEIEKIKEVVPFERHASSLDSLSKKDFVRNAWQDLLDILKKKEFIQTLAAKKTNKILKVMPGSITVASSETGTPRTISRKDFFYYLQILKEKGSLNPREDLEESKFFKKSAIMCAIIAQLPYVSFTINPIILFYANNKQIQYNEEKRKRELAKPKEILVKRPIQPISHPYKAISIRRGYETAGQYVKVGIKVENNSPTTITGVKVILDPPSGLEMVNPNLGVIDLDVILPRGSQGANFQLKPIRCVDDVIHSTILYRDATGKSITEVMDALKIRNICPMLTDDGVDKEHILMSLRNGEISKNTSSFKFKGDLKTAFIVAEARVRGLILLDRDERFINDHFIASVCYIGRTKYGKFDFATEITVYGKENKGLLTISVYSEEEAILSGFFYEVVEDMRKSVEILEERIKIVDEACPECGGKFDKEWADTEGYIRCDFCETLLRLPSWERGKTSYKVF